MTSAVERVRQCYLRTRAAARPEVWITLRSEAEALGDAERIDEAVARGEHLPLAGRTVAVKDNIDVAGLPTTAGCPAYEYTPAVSAPCVERLVDAGAVVLGKTNLDQFATGLVGTRSPYGAVRNAWRPEYVSGGSSSGSAVAVALQLADLGLGTDTAGSGRVPAAFQRIIGAKPTRGRITTAGVVPASRSYDCVSVFARSVAEAEAAVELMADGPLPPAAPLAGPRLPLVAVPHEEQLAGELSAEWAKAFAEAVDALPAEVVRIDLEPFLEGADFLYGSALVAERYAAVGPFVDAWPDAIDPSVRAIVARSREHPAYQLTRDGELLSHVRRRALTALGDADVLLLPTAPFHPLLTEVAASPLELNRRLGRLCAFANPFDLCAYAVPAGELGVTVFARANADRVAADVARLVTGEPALELAGGCELVVFGAHLSGQPLNRELVSLGARFSRPVRTAPRYRMFALPTEPPKPGLLEAGPSGAVLQGELWRLPPAALGEFLARLPEPMTLGRVQLDDCHESVGFFCHASATDGAEEITSFGGWVPYLEARQVAV